MNGLGCLHKCEQVTWSVYCSYPRHSSLDLDIEGLDQIPISGVFLHFKPESILNAQQVSESVYS